MINISIILHEYFHIIVIVYEEPNSYPHFPSQGHIRKCLKTLVQQMQNQK